VGVSFRFGRRLTAPLTFILSRKGREELKEYPLTLTLSRKGRGEKENEKI
jgi:hypothetical protein